MLNVFGIKNYFTKNIKHWLFRDIFQVPLSEDNSFENGAQASVSVSQKHVITHDGKRKGQWGAQRNKEDFPGDREQMGT